jgi:small subunit ribosomal protein S13
VGLCTLAHTWSMLLRPMLRSFASRIGACARPLCSASSPTTPQTLYQLPATSSRRQRIREHGLIAMSADFTKLRHKQQKGEAGRPEESFRVQTYTVPLQKPAEFAIPAVYGYGRSRSKWLAAEVGVFGHYKLSRMRESQRSYIRRALSAACISYDDPEKAAGAALRKEIGYNIQRLIDIRCYRGLRHEARLPCRGQRTRTNSRTRRRMRHP